jgi:hypothetical protein
MAGQLELQIDLGGRANSPDDLLPRERILDAGPPVIAEWDISQTISELAYLTHNFYRYYGKFPPTIPRQLLKDYRPKPGTWLLDNFAGSGTSMVEAKLAGVSSIGIDISPLAALACRVKTRHHDLAAIRQALAKVLRARGGGGETSGADLAKWFTPEATDGLAALKRALLALPDGDEREFLTLAFFAIIRRVSKAYDGEVRPHVNPEKGARDPFDAFARKVRDMLERADEFNHAADRRAPAVAVCGDNRDLSGLDALKRRPIGLIISHPPYLNCFDYVPVYRLEYLWSEGFAELGANWSYATLKSSETRCWPATDALIYEGYFNGIRAAYGEAAKLCHKGTRCAVVLGDCTIKGKVIPVLDHLVALMDDVGFALEKMIYRTTHYGIGKYAYASRADYHGEAAAKRDGVAVFKLR